MGLTKAENIDYTEIVFSVKESDVRMRIGSTFGATLSKRKARKECSGAECRGRKRQRQNTTTGNIGNVETLEADRKKIKP